MKRAITGTTHLGASIGLLLLGLMLGCGKPDAGNPARHDIAPIARRLPSLGHLQAVSWTAVLLSKGSFLSPPVLERVYQLRGIATLERTNVERWIKDYAWQPVPTNQWPALIYANMPISPAEWVYDQKFTKEIAGSLVSHGIYLEFKQGLVYFDLEVR